MSSRIRFLMCILLALTPVACTTTDQQIQRAIEQLAANAIGSPRWQAAVDQLVAIGRPAARQLTAALNPNHYKGVDYREYRAEQEQIRTGAARALGHIRPRGATAALDDYIGSGYTTNERIACIWAIGQMGFTQGGYDALKAQVSAEDQDPRIRLYAAIAITKMDRDDGVPEIETALAGRDESMARIALQGLEECSFYGVPLLVRLVHQEGPRHKELKDVLERVKSRLLAQLRAQDPFVRRRAAQALGRIGDPRSVEPLAALLQDSNNLVRFNAAAALANMDAPKGIQFLFQALQSPDPILRTNAVLFLTRVQRSSGAVQAQLLESLGSPTPLARAGAAQVLGDAHVKEAVPPLIQATRDTSADVRRCAVIALGQIGARSGVERVRQMVEDPDETVSYYAEWALARLGQG